jgi:hypothetical protein
MVVGSEISDILDEIIDELEKKKKAESCNDTNDCEEEWNWAYRECEKLINDPVERDNWRKVGKRPPTLYSCAKGYVSQNCGGY